MNAAGSGTESTDVRVLPNVHFDTVPELNELLETAELHDGYASIGEQKRLDLAHGIDHDHVGIVARGPGQTALSGYAHLSGNARVTPARFGLEIVVHPEHRDESLEEHLVETAVGEVTRRGGGEIHWWVFHATAADDRRAERLGFHLGRELLQMTVPLPIDVPITFPPSVRVRSFRPGEDDTVWLDVNNRAFATHPEQGAWDRETLEVRQREPWFDPDGFLVAEDEGGMAGFCWTKIHAEVAQGEIYVVAAHPSRQGLGLGRALTLAGLASIAKRGWPTGMLYVDGANAAAVGLYRSLGFTTARVDRSYLRLV